MILLINFIKKHILESGLVSLGNLGLGALLAKIAAGLSLVFGLIGAVVGLITIYTFLEKRGLTKNLPKWLKIPNRNKEEENK